MKSKIDVRNMLAGVRAIFYFSICIFFLFLFGCAAGLTHTQKRELEGYKAKGLAIEEKNPGAAAGLGILPGGGSFYTRQYGLGVVDLLFWPLSILWDPINGYKAAGTINYYTTKEYIRRLIGKEIKKLDEDLEDKKITEREYILKQRKIKAKYSVDY